MHNWPTGRFALDHGAAAVGGAELASREANGPVEFDRAAGFRMVLARRPTCAASSSWEY